MTKLMGRRGIRTVLAAVLAAGSLVATGIAAGPAAAVGNGFDPQATQVLIPGTSTVVDEWKLAGSAEPSAVQIAPQWIIASGHAPAFVGSVFTNAYGSATVDRVAGVCGVHFSGCDISVSHLATPIAAPSFPPLLVDGVPDQPGQTPAGDTLAVGMGSSTLGRPDAGWTQPTITALTLATWQSGASAVNGDSGGPAFFYRHGATTGVLQGIMTTASFGVTDGLTEFTSDRVKPFLDGVLPPGTVNWVSYDDLGPRLFRPPPVANPTVTSDLNSVTLSWPPVTAVPPIFRYRAVLMRTDDVRSVQTVYASTLNRTATFAGLTPGVTYGAFVLATNANGESPVPSMTLPNDPANPIATFQTTVAAGPPPAGLRSMTVTSGPNRLNIKVVHSADSIPAIVRTEVVVNRCDSGSCSVGPFTPIADTTFAGVSSAVPLPADTPAGTRFQLVATERNTTGASPALTQQATYVPLAAPLPPTTVRLAPQTDGTAIFSFTAPRADPLPAVLTGYLPHAPADSYEIRLHEPGAAKPVPVTFVQPGTQTTVDVVNDFGLAPGPYTVDVLAISALWGNSAPVAATALLGNAVTPPSPTANMVRHPAPPAQPVNIVVPPAQTDGSGTMTWIEPDDGPTVATPDEFLITMTNVDDPSAPPIVAEVPGTQRSYAYSVAFGHQYAVTVYALSQAAGASAPGTAMGAGPDA